MKSSSYRIKKDVGRYYVLERKPGHNYFERIGEPFFSKLEAEAWIEKLKLTQP